MRSDGISFLDTFAYEKTYRQQRRINLFRWNSFQITGNIHVECELIRREELRTYKILQRKRKQPNYRFWWKRKYINRSGKESIRFQIFFFTLFCYVLVSNDVAIVNLIFKTAMDSVVTFGHNLNVDSIAIQPFVFIQKI